MYNLKAAQMNEQYNLIWELLLYQLKLEHNNTEATKNIYCAKGEGTVDHNTVTRQLKKLCLGNKNLEDQARLDRPKTMDSKTDFQAIDTNLQVTLRENQASWASHSWVWFITLPTSAKAFRAVKLCLMYYQNITKLLTHLSIYEKENDSLENLFW